jgi:hypothetical protein
MATKSRTKAKARKAKARSAAAATDAANDGATGADTVSSRKAKADTTAKVGPGRSWRKGRSAAGRATPARSRTTSGRHTPPVPKNVRKSPRWMGFLIVATFVLGALVVILDYVGLLPGGVNNAWLLAAIGAVFVGLLLATRYH